MAKAIFEGEGELCPKCGETMERFRHPSSWRPRRGQPYHFAYWDRCAPCGHLQHYEQAKVWDIGGKRRERMEIAVRKQIDVKRGLDSGELVLWGDRWDDVPGSSEKPPWETA